MLLMFVGLITLQAIGMTIVGIPALLYRWIQLRRSYRLNSGWAVLAGVFLVPLSFPLLSLSLSSMDSLDPNSRADARYFFAAVCALGMGVSLIISGNLVAEEELARGEEPSSDR